VSVSKPSIKLSSRFVVCSDSHVIRILLVVYYNRQSSFFTAASVMEQVAAVLDALSDAKETTRQQVIGLVERIALRLEKVESKNQQLVRENELLKNQLNMVRACYYSELITLIGQVKPFVYSRSCGGRGGVVRMK